MTIFEGGFLRLRQFILYIVSVNTNTLLLGALYYFRIPLGSYSSRTRRATAKAELAAGTPQ